MTSVRRKPKLSVTVCTVYASLSIKVGVSRERLRFANRFYNRFFFHKVFFSVAFVTEKVRTHETQAETLEGKALDGVIVFMFYVIGDLASADADRADRHRNDFTAVRPVELCAGLEQVGVF